MAAPQTSDDGKSFWCEAPPGWKKRVTYRSTTVNNKSKADVYFYAPSESIHTTRFRSEKKLREYLYKNIGIIPNLPPPEAFDWSYPGGTRDGKCKESGPLTNKAAPDMPRHPPLKTTGKRDPRKRPRDSPNKATPSDGGAEVKQTVANGSASNGAEEGRAAVNGEADTEEPKPKKQKGRPSVAEMGAVSQLQGESAAEFIDTDQGSTPEVLGQAPATEAATAGLEANAAIKPAGSKKKGRPPRIKGAGKQAANESVTVLKKEEEQAPAIESVSINVQAAAAHIEPPSAVVSPEPDGTASQKQEATEADTREEFHLQAERIEPEERNAQEVTDTQMGTETEQRQGYVKAEGTEEAPPVRGAQIEEREAASTEPEGLSSAAPENIAREDAPAKKSEGVEPEVRKDGGNDGKEVVTVKEPWGNAEEDVSLPKETEERVVAPEKVASAEAPERIVKAEAPERGVSAQAAEKIQVTLESIGNNAVRQAPEEAEQSACLEKEEATGTPMSILDAEKGPRSMDVDDEGLSKETAADAPAEKESPQPVRPVEAKAETSPCNDAPNPSSSLPNSELKAMRKKARLAKALGPHEPVARPRREKPPPLAASPTDIAPQGIADLVKLRTAGNQAEKKHARQQGGERVYASRLPPGFSVSAAIAAAAKAAPPFKNRGRPPKQKSGASRLSKQAEEETEEERKERERREEHEAAVRIFKEEEEERDRVLKERGCFYPPDDSLADRPMPAPLNGKRRTKSALVAEHLERMKRMKVDDSEMEDLSDASESQSREALLHRKRMDMRARRRAERDSSELPRVIREDGKQRDVRKKRKGWTAVRTQKRTSMAGAARFRRQNGGAEPSRRPLDADPDPTYNSDANSSELKMGQKLDEHGFFERDEFEVASRERTGRKPPRERLPLEGGAPQRRRSFGHRKGHQGLPNARREERSESKGGVDVPEEGKEGGQEEREPKRMQMGNAWKLEAAPLPSRGTEPTAGDTEVFRPNKHLEATSPLTSC